MPERDRDRSVDHVLRRVLSDSSSVSAESSCVDGETLAAWTSGSLHTEQAAAVESHVAGCARCQAMMAVFVRTEPIVPEPESMWRRWRLGWLVPLATAATAAALWIALPGTATVPSPADSARRSVALESQAPADASAPSPAAPSLDPAAPAPPLRQEKANALAGNESLIPLDEAATRERLEERIAAAAPGAPAPPSAEAEADRRDVQAAPAESFAAARAAVALPLEILAPGGSVRWRIVNGRQVERSTSAGADWMPATIDSTSILTAGTAPSSTVCWIIGRNGAVYFTTEGSRFVRLPFPETVDLVAIAAPDDRTATVSAADGRSWRTVDQGRTWSPVR